MTLLTAHWRPGPALLGSLQDSGVFYVLFNSQGMFHGDIINVNNENFLVRGVRDMRFEVPGDLSPAEDWPALTTSGDTGSGQPEAWPSLASSTCCMGSSPFHQGNED